MTLLHLMTSNNPKMDWCNTLYFNYGHNVTFNFDYTLSRFNDYFATHKANRSRSNGFLPDVYQIWDEVIWLTPEKGRLVSTAPICWEQTEPYPKVSQQLNYNDWKQLGFLPQEICNVIIPAFSNPNSGPPLSGQALTGIGYLSQLACSKRDLLDMRLSPMAMASPWLDREMHPGSSLYKWLYIFRASRRAC